MVNFNVLIFLADWSMRTAKLPPHSKNILHYCCFLNTFPPIVISMQYLALLWQLSQLLDRDLHDLYILKWIYSYLNRFPFLTRVVDTCYEKTTVYRLYHILLTIAMNEIYNPFNKETLFFSWRVGRYEIKLCAVWTWSYPTCILQVKFLVR